MPPSKAEYAAAQDLTLLPEQIPECPSVADGMVPQRNSPTHMAITSISAARWCQTRCDRTGGVERGIWQDRAEWC